MKKWKTALIVAAVAFALYGLLFTSPGSQSGSGDTGEEPQEYQFDAGDFFVLRPGVGYATKNAPGTKILFVKAPGINDKTIIPLTDALTEWAGSWD